MKSFTVRSSSRTQFINIDHQIQEIITLDSVQEGVCTIFIPHTTAAVTINENADPDVVRDMSVGLSKLVPYKEDYRHAEGNSDAHIKSSMFGPSLTVIISEGRLVLGTWQSIYFCEFDGPRQRKVLVKLSSE